MKSLVIDKNGVEIKPGQSVLVHQDEGTREAVVVEPFPDNPTVNAPGHWVDINDGRGTEGMMSYILEVKQLVMVLLLVLCAAPCYGQISFGGRARQSSTHRYDSQSLGTLNGSRYDSNSLSNKYGAGSPYETDGLNNRYSRYGSPYSNDSATNPYATNAPQIYSADGTYHGRLSANKYDPDSTSNRFGQYGSPYSPDSINNKYGAGSRFNTQPLYIHPGRR